MSNESVAVVVFMTGALVTENVLTRFVLIGFQSVVMLMDFGFIG